MECPSCPTSCRKKKLLDLKKLGKFREVPKKLEIKRKCPASQILEITLENCEKITSKTFHRKIYFFLISRMILFFVKDCLLRKFLNIHRKNYLRQSLSLNKIASFRPDTLLEKIPARLFSWDFCDTFKNTFLIELLRVTASKCHFQGII